MQIKSFAATLGIGMLAGAAVTLMLPKNSTVYHTMNDAARGVKNGISNAVQDMMDM